MTFLVDTVLRIDAHANQRTTVRVVHERDEGELDEEAFSSNDPLPHLANVRQFLHDYGAS